MRLPCHRLGPPVNGGEGAEIRARIAALHQRLLDLWEDEIRQFVGLMGPELKNYRRAYEADFRGRWRQARPAALLEAMADADIVFSGDHHTLPAAQRLPIRLLRTLVRGRRPVTLALEMLHSEDQPAVDDYLARRIGAAALRRRIAFDRRWGFDWMHYHAILDFARRHGLGILAINSDPGPVRSRLARRDRHAAGILARRLVDRPGGLLYVMAGDWHVARAHLPRRVLALARGYGARPGAVVVHQNNESLFRRFAGGGSAPPDVLRRGKNLFCVLNATPLAKAESQLRWVSDRAAAAPGEPDGDCPLLDVATTFREMVAALADHLGVRADPWRLTIRTFEDSGALEAAGRSAGISPGRLRAWRRELERGGAVRVPGRDILLLGPMRLNRAAEEAARYILSLAAPAPRRSRRENFHARVVAEGAVFFATRLINPKRKCDLAADLIARRRAGERERFEAAWARAFLDAGPAPPRWQPGHPFWKTPSRLRRRVARTVGALWGYHLFDAYAGGRLDPAWLRRLFRRRPAVAPEILFVEGCRRGGRVVRVTSKINLL
jgi:hypothetical protein